MSESEPQTIENKIVVELNRDKALERKEEEIKELEGKITTIMANEFKQKSDAIANTLGIDSNEINFENFKAYKSMAEKKEAESNFYPKPAPRGGKVEDGFFTAPLNPSDNHTLRIENSDNVPLSAMTFSDESSFYKILNERVQRKDPEAIDIERQLARKAFSNPNGFEIEYQGLGMDLIKSYKPITDDLPDDEKRRRKNFNKELADKKANWTQIR